MAEDTGPVQDVKIDNLETRSKSHHRRLGVLEVQMADVHATLAEAKATRERIEETSKEAKQIAEKAAGAAAKRVDELATTFRNWALFLIAALTLIWTIVKGLT